MNGSPAGSDLSLDALLQQALTAQEAGRFDLALPWLQRAVTEHPADFQPWRLLGVCHLAESRWELAREAFARAVAIAPLDAHSLFGLAVALAQTGEDGTAAERFREALGLEPDWAEARFHLGDLARAAGRMGEAARQFREVMRLDQGWGELARQAMASLPGVGKDAAVEARHHFLRADGWERGTVGVALALFHLREAVRLHPAFPEAWNNLGQLLFVLERHGEAIACFHESLKQQPRQAPAQYNLGVIARELGRVAPAQRFFEAALAVDAGHVAAHVGRSFCLLAAGRFDEGWREYEWRLRLPEQQRVLRAPRWRGEPLAGKRILVLHEQGFGDVLHFCRYLPLLRAQGATVVLECRPELTRLLAGLADEIVSDAGEEPRVDWQVPIMSLPGILGAGLLGGGYLQAPPEAREKWRERLAGVGGLRVGLVWSGNPGARANRYRACALAEMAPLLAVEGISWFSLQKGSPAQELAGVAGVTDLGGELVDFADTAGLLENLELLIATDTAVVHLAGGMGCEAWVMLHTAAEWRWLSEREDSPWYPVGMRLFRQREHRDWGEVVGRVAEALRRRVAEKALSHRQSVGFETSAGVRGDHPPRWGVGQSPT